MAVMIANNLSDFSGDKYAPDGSNWQLDNQIYETNPRLLLSDNDFEMVNLWQMFKEGHLPDSGGMMDQAAIMIDAFIIMGNVKDKKIV
jgi:hypothetical protein